MTYPTLEPVPDELITERLLLRPYVPEDAAHVIEALLESRAELDPWFTWHSRFETIEDAEDLCRRRRADFMKREDLTYALFDRASGRFLGATGLHRPQWEARIFEVGYFQRTSATGHGYMTEAVIAVTRMALDVLHANRVEIWCDAANGRSAAVAERAGFTLEGRLRNHDLNNAGEPCDELVYAVVPDR
jgi:RimJ/RimL family protein N-acetyltransferase